MTDKTNRRERAEILLTMILLTAFLGQVDIRPFSGSFRFSLAVPALSLFLLYFRSANPLTYSIIAGLVMMLLRSLIAAASSDWPITLNELLARQSPFLPFYFTFGLMFILLQVQERSGHGPSLFFSLLTCEVMANTVEVMILNHLNPQPLEKAFFFIVLIGLLRSGATTAVYRLSVYWQKRHDRKQQLERYRRMLLFFSNLKTDILFFRKTMEDIETAMKYSYSLYEKLKGNDLGDEALSISRRIHEVKKEYQRIAASMEKALSGEYIEQPMSLSDIFNLIQANTETLLVARQSPIEVDFKCHDDWLIGHYYTIISIVNNLCINAVEAMAEENGGKIEISARSEGGDCLIEVTDTGPGISEDILDCIFDPGFSTKFNPQTGEMSTGIGLAHVKNIVENYYRGRISVRPGRGARFQIRIPAENLKGRQGLER